MSGTLFRLTMEDIHSGAVIYAFFPYLKILRPPFHGLRLLGEMGLANVAPESGGVSASSSGSYLGFFSCIGVIRKGIRRNGLQGVKYALAGPLYTPFR